MNVMNLPAVFTDDLGLDSKDIRRDLENSLYDQWLKKADGGPIQEIIEHELRTLLEQHAQAVMYVILRKLDPDLLTEAVDKVMMNLETFRGESLFTTWVHRIMMGVMYDQRRLKRRRKEVSLDVPGFDLPGNSSPELMDVLLTVEQLLSTEDYEIFEELALQGKIQQEASETLNISQQTLSRKWERITRTLRHAFVK